MSDVIFNRPQEAKAVTSVFYGIDKGERIPDGYFCETLNMTSDKFPCLASRGERKLVARENAFVTEGEPVAAIDFNGEILIGCSNGKLFRADTEYECETEISDVIPFGDMIYCIPSGELIKDDLSRYSPTRVKYKDIYTVSSEGANCIKITDSGSASSGIGALFGVGSFSYLEEGDYVTVRFYDAEKSDDKIFELETYVSKAEGKDLIIEGSIDNIYVGERFVQIFRKMPQLQFAVTHNNRIWGCYYDGNTNEIYASKLGDPLRWNIFRGLSTDSYAVSVGEFGDFTGCASVGDVIVFFKENCIYTVYGTEPSNFQIVKTDCFGVQKGSEKSIARINGQLYYKSCRGIMRLSEGALPVCVSDDLGADKWSDAVGAADGTKYYVFMTDIQGNREMYCYDTKNNMWHKESECCKNLFRFVNFKNNLLCVGKVSTGNKVKEKRIPLITELTMPIRENYSSKAFYTIAKLAFDSYALTYKEIAGKSDEEIREWYAYQYDIEVADVTDEMLDAFLSIFYKRIPVYIHNVEFSYITNEMSCSGNLPGAVDSPYLMSDEGRFRWSCETGIRGFEASEYKRLKCVELRMKLGAGARCDVSIEYDSSGKWESVYSFEGEGMQTYRIRDRHDKCDTYRIRLSGYGKMVLFSIGEIYEEAGNIGF